MQINTIPIDRVDRLTSHDLSVGSSRTSSMLSSSGGGSGKERDDTHNSIRKTTKQNLLAKQVRGVEFLSPNCKCDGVRARCLHCVMPSGGGSTRRSSAGDTSLATITLTGTTVSGSSFMSSIHNASTISITDDAIMYWQWCVGLVSVGVFVCLCVWIGVFYGF